MTQSPIHVALIAEPSAAHVELYLYSLARCEGVAGISVAGDPGLNSSQLKLALGERFEQAAFYRSYADLVQKDRPDLALVTLEAHHSPEVIHELLKAKCHVLAEKPACICAEDLEPLVTLAASNNCHLMLSLAGRIVPPVLKAKELIDHGYLGKLYGIDVHFVADQARLRSAEYQRSWFSFRQRAGGGHLIWLGIHFLDLIQFVTGQQIRKVTGFTENVGGAPIEVEDAVALSLKLESGAVGTLQCGYYLDQGYQNQVRIWGSLGWLCFDRVSATPLEWYSTSPNAPSGVQTFSYSIPADTGYRPWVQTTIDAVRGLVPAPISGREGLQLLKTVFACYKACDTGVAQAVG
jgi:predicted dehydrogenase